MAQRHVALIDLSRDHYHGLLLAHQILEEDRAVLVGWTSDPIGQAKYVAEFYHEHLLPHFHAEEDGLFPLANANIPAAVETVNELIAEHRALELYTGRFRNPESSSVKNQLREFAQLLESHIRKEERVLFPLVESNATPDVLQQIQEWMEKHHSSFNSKTNNGESRT